MGRPRRNRNEEQEDKVPPFVLDGDTLASLLSEVKPRAKNQIGGSELAISPMEWYDDYKKQTISPKDLKNSPGFDPGPEQSRQVEQMAALGASTTEIAAILKIEPKLLEKYYKYELETSSSRINQKVAQIALQSALGGDTDMVKFWLKTRAGWKETKVTEVTGANGGPVEFREVKQRMLDAIDAEIVDVSYD